MAKDRDNLAAEFDTESSSGFLAEEDAFDRRMLWRLGSWGMAAVGAVTVAVMANQSALTLKRDQIAASDITRQAQQLQTLAKESHNETRRLASAIDTLNGDRDRLYSRVTTLEQGMDSVTGTIARQPAAPASAASPSAPAPGTPPTPTSSAQATAAPTVAAVASTPPAASDKPPTADKVPAPADSKPPAAIEKPVAAAEKPAADKKPVPAAPKPQVGAEKPPASDNAPPASAAAPTVASPMSAAAVSSAVDTKDAAPPPSAMPVMDKPLTDKPQLASLDPAANKPAEKAKPPVANDVGVAPNPPPVIKADPDADAEDEADAPKAQIQRTEFGVDLGTANSVNGLRALWRGLLKSRANAPLAALKPIIVIKENSNGLGMQLRLVAGPLNDAGTAAKICAGLSLVQRTCETAIYDGQRLALTEPPAAARPALPHRRFVPKRAPPPPPPVAEDKKPEPSTLSSMFRRNSQ